MARRSLTAVLALAVVAALAAAGTARAAGELPRLVAYPPGATERFWFDDHSAIGDDHLSWSDQGGPDYTNDQGQTSQREPQGIRFTAAIANAGPGGLEVCGYPSGATGWMRAYQAAPGAMSGGSCPASAPATGQVGWFRYVFARHSATGEFNRWHLMDVERFALVPMPPALGGPPVGTPTVWDNHWGTCLNLLDATMSCNGSEAAPMLDVGVQAGAAKLTQAKDPDAQIIPISVPLHPSLPDARYQVVDLTNPYGLLHESGGTVGSVSCATIAMTIGQTGFSEVAVSVVDPSPATCYVPTAFDAPLSGPGGFDPMAGAEAVPACTLMAASGHCWAAAPHTGTNAYAYTLATGDPAYIPSRPVAQGAPLAVAPVSAPAPAPHQATPVPAPSTAASSATRRALSTARSRTRRALRRAFGRGLSRLKVSCRLRHGGAATCAVSWRRHGARYTGHVYLRTHRVHRRLRWQYRVDVTRRKGHHTTHVRRGYRTGGRA
jgi:hypothetical protein